MARRPTVDVDPTVLILKDVIVESVRNEDSRDLSQRQLAVFLVVSTDEETEHTVRGLALYLNLNKPAITRALDRLGELDLIRRRVDPSDRRSVIAKRTAAGIAYLKDWNRSTQRAMKASGKRGRVSVGGTAELEDEAA